MKNAVFALLIAIISIQSSFAQFIACQYSWTSTYTVTAKSGLKLRDAQSLESKVIGLIPYGDEISVCYDNPMYAKIEGIKGKWVTAFWNGKQGYVFNGFIKAKENPISMHISNSSMDLVNLWEITQFSKDQRYIGLYKTKDYRAFELREIPMKPSDDPRFVLPANPNQVPLWYGQGFEGEIPRKIEGQTHNRMIYLGEMIYARSGMLYAAGNLIKNDSINLSGYEINPYQLRVQGNQQGKLVDQLILQMHCKSGLISKHGYEEQAIVNFIGDLDGDGKNDVLITFQTSYKGWNYGLLSTKYAEKGKLFKEIWVGSGTE